MQNKGIVAIIVFFALAIPGASQDYIRIEGIGPTFKEFDILLVGNANMPDTFSLPTIFVVLDSSTFRLYDSIIVRYLPNRHHFKQIVFGTFEVATRRSGNIVNYYLLDAKTSLLYFKKLIPILAGMKMNKRIIDTLDSYVKLLGG